jgi:hypothetical protein
MKLETVELRLSSGLLSFLRGAIAFGAFAVAVGLLVSPSRTWAGLLLAGYLITCLGLAGIFFVASQLAGGAAWSIAFRRVPEAMAGALPYGAGLLAAVFLAGSSVYGWRQEAAHLAGFKGAWLHLPFFLVRAGVYLLLWFLFTRAILDSSHRFDQSRDPAEARRSVRLSVIFLVVFAVSFWLASFDWVMSLEPHWYSTIFGIYNFAGMFSAGLAAMILLVLWLRRGPLVDFVTAEHLHDLGKYLFAFCTFWMYIWFSQYMLIWYANIPEETVYFVRRQSGLWMPIFLMNLFLNWVVPFVVLLPKWTKRDPAILGKVAAVVLAGRLVDLYLMIYPPVSGETPTLGLWEIGPVAAAGAVFILAFARSFRSRLPVPLADPRLTESLHYHN